MNCTTVEAGEYKAISLQFFLKLLGETVEKKIYSDVGKGRKVRLETAGG